MSTMVLMEGGDTFKLGTNQSASAALLEVNRRVGGDAFGIKLASQALLTQDESSGGAGAGAGAGAGCAHNLRPCAAGNKHTAYVIRRAVCFFDLISHESTHNGRYTESQEDRLCVSAPVVACARCGHTSCILYDADFNGDLMRSWRVNMVLNNKTKREMFFRMVNAGTEASAKAGARAGAHASGRLLIGTTASNNGVSLDMLMRNDTLLNRSVCLVSEADLQARYPHGHDCARQGFHVFDLACYTLHEHSEAQSVLRHVVSEHSESHSDSSSFGCFTLCEASASRSRTEVLRMSAILVKGVVATACLRCRFCPCTTEDPYFYLEGLARRSASQLRCELLCSVSGGEDLTTRVASNPIVVNLLREIAAASCRIPGTPAPAPAAASASGDSSAPAETPAASPAQGRAGTRLPTLYQWLRRPELFGRETGNRVFDALDARGHTLVGLLAMAAPELAGAAGRGAANCRRRLGEAGAPTAAPQGLA